MGNSTPARGPREVDRPTNGSSTTGIFTTVIAPRPGSSGTIHVVSGDTRTGLPRIVNDDRRTVIASRPGSSGTTHVVSKDTRTGLPRIVNADRRTVTASRPGSSGTTRAVSGDTRTGLPRMVKADRGRTVTASRPGSSGTTRAVSGDTRTGLPRMVKADRGRTVIASRPGSSGTTRAVSKDTRTGLPDEHRRTVTASRPGFSGTTRAVPGDSKTGLPRTVKADGRTLIASRPRDNTLFHYVAPGGGKVLVPRIVRPHDELKVGRSAAHSEIKAAFKRDTNHNQRQRRVMASLSYHMLTSTSTVRYRQKSNSCDYEIKHPDVVVYAVTGDTTKLLAEISRNKCLLTTTGEHNHTLLYLTARSGFYDTCEALLKEGAPVNCLQVDGSTPLHGASFYGHRIIVELLLEYGADPTVKNKWGNTPVDEAGSDDVCELFSRYKDDAISKVVNSLMAQNLVSRVRLIEHQGKVIAKEILRNIETLDSSTKCMWTAILSTWETAWHGTKSCYLQSIIRNGLMPSGTKLPDGELIKPPKTHYQLGDKHFGIDNWAHAMFLSPSILYASHVCYAERIFSEGTRWCVVVKGRVEPSSYKSFDPTVYNYDPIDGEPDCPEYRIPVSSDKERIIRVESTRSVVVISIIFIRLDFLENLDSNLTFEELQTMFA